MSLTEHPDSHIIRAIEDHLETGGFDQILLGRYGILPKDARENFEKRLKELAVEFDRRATEETPKSFKGMKNRYTCKECGAATITIDRHDGVTPAMIACRTTEGCKGQSWSQFYRDVEGEPTHEWYKPQDINLVHPDNRQHVEMGGLLLRRIQREERHQKTIVTLQPEYPHDGPTDEGVDSLQALGKPRRYWWGASTDDKQATEYPDPMKVFSTGWPLGTRFILEVPICPECGEATADEVFDHETGQKPCECGFDWNQWAADEWA